MDEDSIAGRSFWAWFKQRIEEFRKVNIKVDDKYNVHTMNHKLTHPKLSTRIYGGIPAFYSMGDINQLPPVFMKSIADDSQISSNNADDVGKYAFSDFEIYLIALKLLITHFTLLMLSDKTMKNL